MNGKYVFISYSSQDMEYVIKAVKYLESHGVKCWVAYREVPHGDDYRGAVIRAIDGCAAFVLLSSPDSDGSVEVRTEVGHAFSAKKVLQNFKLVDFKNCDELMYNLQFVQSIDAYKNFDDGLSALLSAVKPLCGITDMTRADVAEKLIKLTEKFSYCLLNRFEDKKFDAAKFKEIQSAARSLFGMTVSGSYKNEIISGDTDYAELMSREIINGHTFRVHGLPGAGKNLLVQLVFHDMLQKFVAGASDCLPVYLSSAYYEKYEYGSGEVNDEMRKNIELDLADYFEYLEANKNVRPAVLLEGVREYSFAKVYPEKYIFDIFKRYGNYGRAITIDTGLILTKSRLKKVIPIAGEPREDYCLRLEQIPLENEPGVKRMISYVADIYRDEKFDADKLVTELKRLKYTGIDVFLIRLVAHEMSAYDEIGSVSDMYYRFIGKEYGYDDDRIYEVSQNLFNYIFFGGAEQSASKYDGKMWSFPNKHNTYLGYLIAYYFIKRVQSYDTRDDYEFFKVIPTVSANQFIVSMVHNNYELQRKFEKFIETKFEAFDVRQKCNAAYWLGRMDCDSRDVKNFAISFLTGLLTTLDPLVCDNNSPAQDNLDRHMLYRSVCTGLMYHDQANMLDKYIKLVITNDIANAVNRGATVEYFGEGYQVGEHNTCNLDKDYHVGEAAIRALCARVEAAFNFDADKFVENNLVTLLTLLQARIQSSNVSLLYDVPMYVDKALGFLNSYKSKPHNISSQCIRDYLESVAEDFKLFAENGKLDVATKLYNDLDRLEYVKRAQWKDRVTDPESVLEHMYSSWMLAVLFLPAEYDSHEGYDKREIMDMLLVHDMARANDYDSDENSASPEADSAFLRKLFLKGTYPDVANLTHYYDMSTSYCNNSSLNAQIAHDINVLQAVYLFFDYIVLGKLKADAAEIKAWAGKKSQIKTKLGTELFERLIDKNPGFAEVLNAAR